MNKPTGRASLRLPVGVGTPPRALTIAGEPQRSRPATTTQRPGETYTTGEMARLSKNTLRTVRFYEEAGILHPIGRTEGGHRVFEKSQLDRLMWITDMREAGMSLEQIRGLLDMKRAAATGGDAARHASTELRKHIEELRTKIGVLVRLSEDLERTVDATTVCSTCSDAALFPNQCGDCGRIATKAPLPRGMRVLWDVAAERPAAGPDPSAGKV